MNRFSLLGTIVLAFSLLFTGCGGGGDVTGTWQLDNEVLKEAMKDSMLADMGDAEIGEAEQAMLDGMLAAFDDAVMTMTFASDNTITMKATGMGPGQDSDESGTWSMEDGKIKITVDGDDGYATLEGGRLHLTLPGEQQMPELIFDRK